MENRRWGFLTSLIRDISDRKQSEELLQKSEDRFRNLAQSSTEAIIIIDSEGAIIFWNKSAERMYGYTQEEVLAKIIQCLFPPGSSHRVNAILNSCDVTLP